MAIQVLDQNTINKIAAGEVIERPSSVVKELVENAIDASASAITIEIKEGGISFVRITDNGSGIPAQELPLAFLRHSTSKIKSVEDLLTVSSLGFRGEALSSIAAVAQVELITKTREAFTGRRYVIEGGEEISNEEIGAPDGTTFIVRNLFYNTPVRKKFLKTAMTEGGYINALAEHLAFSNPNISFRFISNGQNKLHTTGNGNLKEIIYHIYGREVAGNLIEIQGQTQDFQITGFLGKPMTARGNRACENYYVNGRYIKSSILSRAIEEGYQGFIMQHRYPFTVLHFHISPQLLDVNVHPTKMELRFSQNEFVYDFVRRTVKEALSRRELIPQVEGPKAAIPAAAAKRDAANGRQNTANGNTANGNATAGSAASRQLEAVEKTVKAAGASGVRQEAPSRSRERYPEPFEVKRRQSMEQMEALQAVIKPVIQAAQGTEKDALQVQEASGAPAYKKAAYEQQVLDEKLLSVKNSQKIKLLGQLFETYWLIEFEDKFFIMDQHAAHEKVLYEKMMKALENGQVTSQQVNPPMILSLHANEENVLKSNLATFQKMGFEMEPFGGKEYKVTAMPASLPRIDEKDLLIEMLDALAQEGGPRPMEMIAGHVASMACKAAIKGNNRLSAIEAKALIDQLMELENPYHCPHGRPTLITMSRYEIEKKFKRIV